MWSTASGKHGLQQPARPLTDAEGRARKRALELVQEDSKRLCGSQGTAILQPFANLQDAVERLLPFHVLGSLEPAEADLEELALLGDDAQLLSSRAAVTADLAVQAAVDAATAVDGVRERLERYAKWYDTRGAKLLPEEELRVEQALKEEAARALETERGKAQLGTVTSSDEEDEEDEDDEEGDGEAGAPPARSDGGKG